MSRIGKIPVEIPAGVTVSVDGYNLAVKGPKGSLEHKLGSGVKVEVGEKEAVVELVKNDPQGRANYGTTRAIVANMVHGVTTGWTKELELQGVGYTASLSGNKLKLVVGYSHDVFIEIPKIVQCKVQKTNITLESIDKQVVGNLAASIRKVKPPEPYLGKGIRYVGEQVRRKAGKAGKK